MNKDNVELTHEQAQAYDEIAARDGCLYVKLLDRTAMWDPQTLDRLVEEFPTTMLGADDLYLLLAECISNAAEHGRADVLIFSARKKNRLLQLSFYQDPPLTDQVGALLAKARANDPQEYIDHAEGGLGFPILLRMAYNVTLSGDRRSLHLWFRL